MIYFDKTCIDCGRIFPTRLNSNYKRRCPFHTEIEKSNRTRRWQLNQMYIGRPEAKLLMESLLAHIADGKHNEEKQIEINILIEKISKYILTQEKKK